MCSHQSVWLTGFGSHHGLPYHLSVMFVSLYVLVTLVQHTLTATSPLEVLAIKNTFRPQWY